MMLEKIQHKNYSELRFQCFKSLWDLDISFRIKVLKYVAKQILYDKEFQGK